MTASEQIAETETVKTVSKKGKLQHVEINVSNFSKSSDFYEAVLSSIGYRRVLQDKDVAGWGNGQVMVFIVRCGAKFLTHGFHRKRVGLNHVAFFVESREAVDTFCKQILAPMGARVLYDGPRVFPEYGESYYSVYFEDPDRIKLEVFTA